MILLIDSQEIYIISITIEMYKRIKDQTDIKIHGSSERILWYELVINVVIMFQTQSKSDNDPKQSPY